MSAPMESSPGGSSPRGSSPGESSPGESSPGAPGRSSPSATWRFGELEISDAPDRIDLDVVHGYLVRSYWATGIPRELVARSLEHSLVFGAYLAGHQVGFARVVSDRATFAWLCDVFVIEEARGRGVSKRLMECVLAHPELQGLRRFSLATRDAHGLYARYGFEPLGDPTRCLEIVKRDVYLA